MHEVKLTNTEAYKFRFEESLKSVSVHNSSRKMVQDNLNRFRVVRLVIAGARLFSFLEKFPHFLDFNLTLIMRYIYGLKQYH